MSASEKDDDGIGEPEKCEQGTDGNKRYRFPEGAGENLKKKRRERRAENNGAQTEDFFFRGFVRAGKIPSAQNKARRR